jgi:hypothetical protein
MSSTVSIKFGPDTEGVLRVAWDPWAEAHGLVLNTGNGLFYPGGNVGTEVSYVHKREITFSTFFAGPGMQDVAALALEFWAQFGGSVTASPELAGLIRARFLQGTASR